MALEAMLREALGEEGLGYHLSVGHNVSRLDVRDGLLIVVSLAGRTFWIPLSYVKLIYP